MQIVILIVEPALEVAPQQVCFLPRARFNRIFAVYTDLSYQRMVREQARYVTHPSLLDLALLIYRRTGHSPVPSAGYSRPMPRVRSTIASPI